jgi:hypothetical protein
MGMNYSDSSSPYGLPSLKLEQKTKERLLVRDFSMLRSNVDDILPIKMTLQVNKLQTHYQRKLEQSSNKTKTSDPRPEA